MTRARELGRGSRGTDVKALQRELTREGFSPGDADGDFGGATEQAVRDFQRSRGLDRDGVVGSETWRALGIDPAPPREAGPRAFLDRAARPARVTAKEFGLPASVALAQAALESNWGRAHMGDAHNYFGIKAFERQGRIDYGRIAVGYVTRKTKEVVDGRTVTIDAHFRRYATMTESFRDYGNFLRSNERYEPAFAHTDDPDEFARAIARAGYATDPDYGEKLVRIMRDHDLYGFDRALEPPEPEKQEELGGVSLDREERKRAFIAAAQRDIRRVLENVGAPRPLAIDGKWDEHTDRAFRDVCRVLGITPERTTRTFRLIAAAAASPTAEEKTRAASEGAAYAEELRRRHSREGGLLGGPPLPGDDRDVAYVVALKRDLTRFLARHGDDRRLALNGEWDEHTERAFRDVCRVLGIAPERTVRTFRLIAGATASRTAEEKARAASDGAAYAKKLRARAARRRPRVHGGRPLPRDDRRRARVVIVQESLNGHLRLLDSPLLLAVDGRWGEHTDRAFHRVCRVLGLEPTRNARTYRAIAGALAPLTAAERERAATDGAAYERQLRSEFARQWAEAPPREPEPPRPPRREPPDEPGKPRSDDERLARLIHRHRGRAGSVIVREARRHGLPVSLLCAVIERESGFQMVFGRDSPPGHTNPVKSPPNGLLAVTRERYEKYLRHRKAGEGNQGVGFTQLTSPSLQDRADKLGGCWKVGPNVRVGAEYLAGNIRRLGLRQGIRQYNGSGPAAERYADAILAAEKVWRARLATGSGPPSPPGTRTLRLADPRLEGPDVKAFQRVLNRWYRRWKVPHRLSADGKYGPLTRRAAREVAFGLGIATSEFERGFSRELRAVMAAPGRRSGAQRERARRRAAFRRRLRRRYAAPSVEAMLQGRRMPRSGYLRRAIVRAHRHGLVVTSTNDGRHARTSWHYKDLAVDFGVPASVVGTAEHTKRLVAFQLELLEDRPQILELFGPRATHCVKNGAQITISGDLKLDHLDHVHLASSSD